MMQEVPPSVPTHRCPKCGTEMVIYESIMQIAPLERYSLDHLADNWFLWPVAGLIAFLHAPNKRTIEDHLHCPSCGEDGPTVLAKGNEVKASTPRRNLTTLLSPDFIGSVVVVVALVAILIAVLVAQPLGELLRNWIGIGLLVAAILFLLRIFVFPLLCEALGLGPAHLRQIKKK